MIFCILTYSTFDIQVKLPWLTSQMKHSNAAGGDPRNSAGEDPIIVLYVQEKQAKVPQDACG